jgi:hypothetical protein
MIPLIPIFQRGAIVAFDMMIRQYKLSTHREWVVLLPGSAPLSPPTIKTVTMPAVFDAAGRPLGVVAADDEYLTPFTHFRRFKPPAPTDAQIKASVIGGDHDWVSIPIFIEARLAAFMICNLIGWKRWRLSDGCSPQPYSLTRIVPDRDGNSTFHNMPMRTIFDTVGRQIAFDADDVTGLYLSNIPGWISFDPGLLHQRAK